MLPHYLLEPCPPIFPPNTPVGVVLDEMVGHGSECVLVVDAERLIGIFTAWDVVRLLANKPKDESQAMNPSNQRTMPLMQVPLGDYMSQPVVTVPAARLNDRKGICALFVQAGLTHLPVVDPNGCPVGLVSWAKMIGSESVEWEDPSAVASTCSHSPVSDWADWSDWSDLSAFSELLLQPSEVSAATERMQQRLQQIFAMGHDLRSPLNVILGLAQLMSSSPEIPPAQRVNVETISNSGYQLLGLINQVLRLTQQDISSSIASTSNGSASDVLFPENHLSMANHQRNLPSRRITGLAPNQPNYRVLIVDDQPSNCRLLRAFLSVLKVDVQEANDGKDAIALWQTWHPHLIWMDVQMPVMNGYEATQAIRQLEQAQIDSHPTTASDVPPHTPTKIIALTASARKDEDELAKASGCDDFVRKPFPAELFFDKMALHLGWEYCYQDDAAEVDTPSSPVDYSNHVSLDLSANSANPSATADASATLCPTDFQIMSADWIDQIHRAALGCDDYQIKQLLTEIPDSHTEFRHKLDLLIHNYQFDQIIYSVRAIQTSAGNANSEGTN